MRGDQPITSKREDLLDRAGFANAVARTIRTIDASRGAVVAVMAPWGTGKTSLVNMVLETLHEAPALTTIEFNPWLFSGTDQLLLRFFGELATQIRLKAPTQQRVADLLLVYGQLISPLQLLPAAGPWIGRLRTVTSWVAGRLRGNTTTNSAEEQRQSQRGADVRQRQPARPLAVGPRRAVPRYGDWLPGWSQDGDARACLCGPGRTPKNDRRVRACLPRLGGQRRRRGDSPRVAPLEPLRPRPAARPSVE